MKSLFIYMSRCTPFSTNVCFGFSSWLIAETIQTYAARFLAGEIED